MANPGAPESSDSGLDVAAAARRAGLFAVVAVAAVAAIATLPGIGEVRERLSSAEPLWIAAAGLCSIMSMLGFVRALWAVFDRVVPWRRALALGLAEQGANVLLPAGGAGGPAFGTFVMRRAGVPGELAAERHAALFLATSAVSFFALVIFGAGVAIGVLPGEASPAATLIPAAAAAAVIGLAVVYARLPPPVEPVRGRARIIVWRVRRFLHGGVRTTFEVLRHGDRLVIAGAVSYYAFDVASLACAFQAFGGDGLPAGHLRARVYARPLRRAAADARRHRRHRGRADRRVRGLRRAARPDRRGRALLPRLPARPAGPARGAQSPAESSVCSRSRARARRWRRATARSRNATRGYRERGTGDSSPATPCRDAGAEVTKGAGFSVLPLANGTGVAIALAAAARS